jgi:hypothetical protein
MDRQTTERAGDVKARQAVVPTWMTEFEDDEMVVVTTKVTPFGDFCMSMSRVSA